MKQKLVHSALYSYDRISDGKLFNRGRKIRKSAMYINAKDKVSAINTLMNKLNQPIFNLEDLGWLTNLIETGYITISDDEEDTFDTMTDLKYKYYCECIYEI